MKPVIIVASAVFLLLPLFLCAAICAVFFVSIIWTHRPDLSLADILKDTVREIKKNFINFIAGMTGKPEKTGGKEKKQYEDYYL